MKIIIIIIVTFLLNKNVQSQYVDVDPDPDYYSFYPGSTLSIGRGVSPNDLTIPKIPCLNFEKENLEEGAISTEFHTYLARSFEQLNLILDIDNKVSASFLSANANYGFKINSNLLFTTSSITIVIKGKTEFGRIGMKPGFSLTPAATNLLSTPSKFCEVCGTKFVSMERRAVSVATIITLQNLKNEEVVDINTEAGGGGGFGPISGSATTKIQAYMKRASEQGNINVEVFSTGGGGIGSLNEVVSSLTTDSNSIDKIQAALGTYLKTFTKDNSVPMGFHLTPFTSLGLNLDNIDLWQDIQEKKLRELVEKYRYFSNAIDLVRMITKQTSVIRSAFSNQEIIDAQSQEESITKLLEFIADAHKKLKSGQITPSQVSIDESMINKSLIEKIIKLLGRPSVTMFLFVDGSQVSLLDSRIILEPSRQRLIDRARQFYPNANLADSKIIIEGSLLHSFTLKFEKSNGDVAVLKTYRISNNKFLYSQVQREKDFSAYREMFEDGDFNGYYTLEVVDTLGRKFKYRIRYVEWKNDHNGGIHSYIKILDIIL